MDTQSASTRTFRRSKRYAGKTILNVLPCRINHNGAVNATKRYWNPQIKDGKQTAYFRGRRLCGRSIQVPQTHRGCVAVLTEDVLPMQNSAVRRSEDLDDSADADLDCELLREVLIIEEQATFDEVIIWGHEMAPDEQADPYVRGIEEWMAFASRMHSYELPLQENDEPTSV